MFFANLTLVEFFALFAALAAATVALYLLIRARRQLRVASLRFFVSTPHNLEQKRRRRIDQPWSLLLQLLALLCLLLAIAQPRLGRPDAVGLDHVLLLDSSAWTQARLDARQRVFDDARRRALDWLRQVPAQDRVMLVRADALATPLTHFESNHATVEVALRSAEPAYSALDLQSAFDLAVQAQRLEARHAGEIVYAGPGLVSAGSAPVAPANLRLLETRQPPPNVGLTRVSLRRSVEDPARFEASITARNYASTRRQVPFTAGVGGALVTSQLLTLPPLAEASAAFSFRATAAGWLEARLDARDAIASDDRATIEIPAPRRFKVVVYSAAGEALRPLLDSDSRVEAVYHSPAEYTADVQADLVILDSFNPARLPAAALLLIRPGGTETTISRWSPAHPAAAGLRSRDLKLKQARLLQAAAGDVVVAESAQGPLILAHGKNLTLGFHPLEAGLRYELTTPLLFANILAWLAPETFQHQEAIASTPGSVSVELRETVAPESLRVLDERGAELPFTLDGRLLRFFAPQPAAVRVLAPGSEMSFALSLPGLAAEAWTAPPAAARGLAERVASLPLPRELWRIFALLGLALLVLEWWLYRNRQFSRLSLALKAAAVVAGLASIFEPGVNVRESKLAVGVLADTSASLPARDLAQASRLAGDIDSQRGRNTVRVLPFARAVRPAAAEEFATGWKLRSTAGEAGRATSLENAIREATASLPAGLLPRLVLISDGRENQGSVARAAWQARQLGIPIDTYALPGRAEPKLKLESLSLPAAAFTGERIPIELAVAAPAESAGTLEISAEGKLLGSSPLRVMPGLNQFHVTASITTPGAIGLSLRLRTQTLGEMHFDQALAVRRPRLLYLSQDVRGMESHLLSTLNAAQFDVVSDVDFGRARFDDYQIVLFNNWDLESIPPARKAELERYIQQGGGLLVIGGERNIYVEKKQPNLDPLDRALPATVAPPRSPEGAAVVLIIDKSSSMEGRKIELARLAAVGVVENLRPIDVVGVLIFDNSFQWAVPLRRAEDRAMIKRLVAGITPDGGTQIAPALTEAYKRILPSSAAFKHIVLLTDGISEEGDSMTLAKDAANNRITISTVGLGQDVNRAYLERVAVNARGKAYFLTDPSGLEQILLKDVKEHTGSTTVERSTRPVVTRRAEILDGLDMDSAPALKGYVRFQAKPTAETLLTVASSSATERDPLLARWQFGLGRAAVFTSDAKTRWAADWVTWKGYDKFWANLTRDLLPHAQPSLATLSYDATSGQLVGDFRLAPAIPEPERLPELYVLGPDGFQVPARMERLAADHYRASAALGGRRGLFRLRGVEESRAFPEIGLYLPEPEITTYGGNPQLLRQVSAYTGGRFQPTARQVFDAGGRSIAATLRLWPGLLAAAMVLNLLELAWRRLRTRVSPSTAKR